jgi:UDP-N-acetyl-D-glucosamine dehydrogenase
MSTLEKLLRDDLQTDAVDRFLQRIGNRTARIVVVGMGYVGLPLALLLCEEGFPVIGLDVDARKVEILNGGGSHIARIAESQIRSIQANGFRASSDYAEVGDADAIIICVPTPLDRHQSPDLSFIRGTAEAMAPYLTVGQLIVLESTTYPGTTEDVLISVLESACAATLRANRNGSDDGFYVAYSPEREDPGNKVFARRDIPKIVSGVSSEALQMAASMYRSIFAQVVTVSSPAVAEMAKLLENIYRCVNIALVNELKQLCHRMGLDVFEVIEAARTKPFGFQAFYPGPGLGGHCIPIDPFYLSWKAKQYDFRTRFIELAGEVNASMPHFVVARTADALNSHMKPLMNSKILVLGVAYKRDIDDIRESPSLPIIKLLRDRGATVSYNDPYCPYVGQESHFNLDMSSVPLDELVDYDCVLIITDHSDYDYERIVSESKLVVDTRNATKGIRSDKIVHC